MEYRPLYIYSILMTSVYPIYRLFVTQLLTQECYVEYIVKYNFLDEQCFKSTLSKGRSFSLLAGSILVYVPQILKILISKSAEGISIDGVCLELFAITSKFAHSYVMGFPLSAEGTFLAIQTAIIAALVLHYRGSPATAAVFLATYVGIVYTLVSGFTPKDVLLSVQAVNVPLIVAAKSIQVFTNYKNGSTGQLSALTYLLLFGGSIARIFTSIQKTEDFFIILNDPENLANGAIVLQLFWYWNVDKTNKNKNKKKEKCT